MTTIHTLRSPDGEDVDFEDTGGLELTKEYAADSWDVPVADIRVVGIREVRDHAEWAEKFKPIRNKEVPEAPYDGTMFETYGSELEFVKAQDPKKVWTLLDCDGMSWISAGFHFVNRLGYFVTAVPFTEEDEKSEGWLG